MNIKDIIFAIDILSHPQSGDESDINLALYTAIEALKAWKEVLEQAERDMLDGNINRMMITSLKSIDGLLEKITQLPTEEARVPVLGRS